MNETDLIQRFKDGDEEAFRILVEKYHRQIFDLCFRYVGNQEDAEEVAQDVFIRVFNARASYEPKAKFSTYLYRVAVNLSLNRIRDRKRRRVVALESIFHLDKAQTPGSSPFRPDQILEQNELQTLIGNAIESLPPNQRTAVLLKRFEGLSYEEIAEVMECSVSAVEARLHRAKLNLNKRLRRFMT